MQALSVGLALAAVPLAVSGLVLVLRRRATAAGPPMLLSGLVGVAAAVALATGHHAVGARGFALAAAVLFPVALMLYPTPRLRHPLDVLAVALVAGTGLAGSLWGDPAVSGQVTGLIQSCVFVPYVWWRVERAREQERRALIWMVLAVGSAFLVYGFISFASSTTSDVPAAAVAIFAVIGPALYVGATLPDLVDVRGLVVSAVVFAVAVITMMALFVLVIALLDLMGAHDLNLGATALLAGLTAATFRPTQVLLRGVVDQMLFGSRPDPLDAASNVADRIGDDPVVALRAIREALVVPYAALVAGGASLAASGTETTHCLSFDLDGTGTLVVGLRPGDLSFSPGDEQVLRLVVPLLAQALRARALADQVLESRGQTIAAVEEERRRLRRELHDGLGPRLSGVAFTSDAARNLIRTDPEAAEAMVAQLRADTVIAIEEIRRMVYAMRPPALDELGLVPALQQQTAGLRNRSGQSVQVAIAAPVPLTELPAAVEVAAYRIVVEALTNVARHSSSPAASVRLEPRADGLHVEVTDAGGIAAAWRPGVGLSSMRERAAELGGTLEAGPGASGGRVAALLPLTPG